MKHLETEFDVNAPAGVVWQVVSDLANWPEWTDTVRSIDVLGDGSLAPGTKARLQLMGSPGGTWTVDEVSPGKSFTWSANLRGVTSVASHELIPHGDRTTVRLTLDFSGLGATLFWPMIKRNSLRNLAIESAGLAKRSEEIARSL